MPQVRHDGTAEHRVRDMALEDTTSKDGGGEEEKSCLEVVLWFFLPITLLLLQLKGGN